MFRYCVKIKSGQEGNNFIQLSMYKFMCCSFHHLYKKSTSKTSTSVVEKIVVAT